jgi:hypothetical protein
LYRLESDEEEAEEEAALRRGHPISHVGYRLWVKISGLVSNSPDPAPFPCGSEECSYLRLIDFFVSINSRLESDDKEEEEALRRGHPILKVEYRLWFTFGSLVFELL